MQQEKQTKIKKTTQVCDDGSFVEHAMYLGKWKAILIFIQFSNGCLNGSLGI